MTALHDVVDPKDVQVTIRGLLPDRIRGYAREKVAREINRHDGRVLGTHIVITQSNDPAIARPCTVEVGVDLSGRPVRAQVAASGATEAVDLAVDRLQRRLATAIRWQDRRRRTSASGGRAPGEWRHGDPRAHRPPYFPRPAEERRILRRKTFVLAEETVQDAIADMELLGHSFFLFVDGCHRRDAVVHRREDGRYAVMGTVVPPDATPPTQAIVIESDAPLLAEGAARARLDVTDEPFVFFRDVRTRRGCVMYRRYDGNYGLITPV
jgi:ribosome-associated translation inhibitor RaiA